MGVAVCAVVVGFSAKAACGGGGYTPSNSKPANYTTPAAVETSAVNSRRPGFDASYFHAISGKLKLSGEQATNVINALNDIRRKEGSVSPKEFDARKEFETRLATILTPQQLKTYREATVVSFGTR